MKNILKIFTLVILAFFVSNCDEYDNGSENTSSVLNYSFKKANDLVEVEQSNPVYKIVVAASEVSSSDRTIAVVLDETASTYVAGDFTFSGSVVIPAGSKVGEAPINFNYGNLVLGQQSTLVFDLVKPDDGSLINTTGDRTTVKYTQACLFNKIKFELVLDRYGSETTWNITKSGTVVASGGPYTDGATNALQAQKDFNFCLENGSYILNVFDAYGDGLYTSATVQGSYKIKNASGTVLVQGGGDFGTASAHPFTLN